MNTQSVRSKSITIPHKMFRVIFVRASVSFECLLRRRRKENKKATATSLAMAIFYFYFSLLSGIRLCQQGLL